MMLSEENKMLVFDDEFTTYFLNQLLKDKAKAYKQFSTLTPTQLEEYKILLSEFIEHHKDDVLNKRYKRKDKKKETKVALANTSKITTKEVGDQLENLVLFIFKSLSAFKATGNVRINSNEIDHVIELSGIGRLLVGENFCDFSQNYFLGESKNYNERIKVTWINKVYSLMSTTTTKLGIIFSYHGFCGVNKCGGWQDAKGFTKKILIGSMGLSGKNEDDAMYIIDFNIKHFLLLGEGKSFIEIIEEEKRAMKLDVKSEVSTSEKYDCESKISEIISTIKK